MTDTQPSKGTQLVNDIGMLLGASQCDLVKCEIALAYVMGDVLAQMTERTFDPDILNEVLVTVGDAYKEHCTFSITQDDVAPTIN